MIIIFSAITILIIAGTIIKLKTSKKVHPVYFYGSLCSGRTYMMHDQSLKLLREERPRNIRHLTDIEKEVIEQLINNGESILKGGTEE